MEKWDLTANFAITVQRKRDRFERSATDQVHNDNQVRVEPMRAGLNLLAFSKASVGSLSTEPHDTWKMLFW
jgi:hypothetical protein